MKRLLLIAILLFSSLGVFAQFSFGVKGGVNASNMTNIKESKTTMEAKMKASFHVGAFANYQLNETLHLQPEILYSRQGFYSNVGQHKVKWRANYINVPILLRIHPITNFSIDIGPQIGFLLNTACSLPLFRTVHN